MLVGTQPNVAQVTNSAGTATVPAGIRIFQSGSNWCVSDQIWAFLNGSLSKTTYSCATATLLTVNGVGAAVFTLSSSSESAYLNQTGGIVGFHPASNSISSGELWSITPTVPSGLTFNTSTGTLSGAPVAILATTVYTVRETDVSNNLFSTQTFTLTVLPALPPYTWTANLSSSHDWSGVASSSDGTHLAAVGNYSDYIWTSTNSGVTWQAQLGSSALTWNAIASSSDGSKLIAVAYANYIWTSADSGATWVDQVAAGSRNWAGITSSADGTKLAATAQVGDIYTSYNSGVTWVDQVASGSRNWSGIASSSDGTKLIAGELYGGNLWTSTDSGVTWVDQVATGNGYWHAVASSSDGTHLVAGDGYNAGDVWTGVLIS